ncbi:uncharacterized protein [Montipora foliosa]|uniref:uncharacterized protein isoform X2 n=1 Tax=Montipora foliosa TaxID=591990 RepID=UPI0035F1FE69
MMKVFFVALIGCHLFVTKSMASSAHGMSKNKVEVYDALGQGVNSTGPDDQYSESGSPRAIVDPTDLCYTQYFVGHQPPTGFRPFDSQYIKHICQQVTDDTDVLYSTMFDEKIGIPVYVGYGLEKDQVPRIGTFPRISKWFQDAGIGLQGSDRMYHGNEQKIHKGHLVPAETYSFGCINIVSTFTYTNAVPQYAAFNIGPWAQDEKKVRAFAKLCSLNDGDLYLLTGISEAKITEYEALKEDMDYFPINNKDTGVNIAIPNSMWTAGCCIKRQDGVALGGFAVIGNNVQDNPKMNHLNVKELQNILAIGIGEGAVIDLFPGKKECSDNLNQYQFDEEGGMPGWTKVKKL